MVVDLDSESDRADRRISARVLSVDGPVARLHARAQPEPELLGRLRPGALGYLTFARRSKPRALRGVALWDADGDELEFVIIDESRLAERRTAIRHHLVTSVRASSVDDRGRVVGTTTSTVTSNLSTRGALIVRRPGFGSGPRWMMELALPSEDGCVRCQALLVRETVAHLAVKFVDLEEADRIRLARALAADR